MNTEQYKMYARLKTWAYIHDCCCLSGIGVVLTEGPVANAAETTQSAVNTVKNTTNSVTLQNQNSTTNKAIEQPAASTQNAVMVKQPDQTVKTDAAGVNQPATNNKGTEKETEPASPTVTTKDKARTRPLNGTQNGGFNEPQRLLTANCQDVCGLIVNYL